MKNYTQIKKRVFEIISKGERGDLISQIFDWSIMTLIALSVISIILESFADLYAKWQSAFRIFEAITVIVFTIEYILRIWTADLLYPEAKHPRIKYFFPLWPLSIYWPFCRFTCRLSRQTCVSCE